MAERVALISGYGPNVRFDVAEALGCQIQADFSDPSTIEGIFSKVINEFGHQNVVVYKAFQCDNSIRTVSSYIAAHLATNSCAILPPEASKMFIYTSNKLTFMVVRPLFCICYFADERKSNGDPVYGAIDGPAYAAFYIELARRKTQEYVAFSEVIVYEIITMQLYIPNQESEIHTI
ncbi:hypothetical protein V8C42DRAFT_356411 [Trichoderma barbatum]